MKLFGLSGTNGSGKDTVGHLLAEKYGYLYISSSELLRDEAARRNMPIERESLRTISAEWRRAGGLGVLVDKAVEAYKELNVAGTYKGLITGSLRNPGEADRIHELGGHMIWTDADPKIRYDRIYSRQRTAEDNKTFEQFLAEEAAEMTQSGDTATLNMAAVKEKIDIFIQNNGNDIEVFKIEAEKQLQNYL